MKSQSQIKERRKKGSKLERNYGERKSRGRDKVMKMDERKRSDRKEEKGIKKRSKERKRRREEKKSGVEQKKMKDRKKKVRKIKKKSRT